MHLNYILYGVIYTARCQNTPKIELLFINFELILHFSFSLFLFTIYKIIYFKSTL